MIVGIDEVGRGAWAGPLVVGAVLLGDVDIQGLTDSKKLTPKKRQLLAGQIKTHAKAIGLGWVSAETIDRIGLSEALKMAARLAVKDIQHPYDQIIIDGTIKLIEGDKVSTLKQADLLIPSVSAASIVAKVARDYYMSHIAHEEHAVYGFDKHVGYGTALHSAALVEHGPSSLHRLSFAPVQKALGKEITKPVTQKVQHTIGRKAEEVAADFLQTQGFDIVERNWRTKLCEIDIVATKDGVTHLVEVKYRKTAEQGGGISAITPKKLKQMQFAARIWQYWKSDRGNIRLSVVTLSGTPPKVEEYLDL